MKLDSQQKKIVSKLCIEFNLTEKEIIEIVESPFKFIREEIKQIEIIGNETQEEFENKIKNFNIPSIGKLYGNYYNLVNINKRKNVSRKRQEESSNK